METNKKKKVNIAVTGCIHGSLKKMYNDIWDYSNKKKINIDLVICTGDFECMIENSDLNYLSCPPKYKTMGDFHKYYKGQYPIPFPTIFIGGNHEASNILNDNFYGGYIMEKIFYLGRAGVVNFKGIRIAGISGIYKKQDYLRGHYETDLANDQIKSIYHVREFEIAKLSHLTGNIDIIASHDWPNGIVNKKDIKSICKIKPFWKDELLNDNLGSPFTEYLLKLLKPKNWICGHMHYYYTNTLVHENNTTTNVIALDKCLKNRNFFDIIEIETEFENLSDDIYIDGEWIAITKMFNEIFPNQSQWYNLSNYFRDKQSYLPIVIDVFFDYNKFPFKASNISEKDFEDKLKKLKEESKSTLIPLNDDQYTTIMNIFGINNENSGYINKNIAQYNFPKYGNAEEIDIELG